MRQLNFLKARELEWRDVPMPTLPDDDAVIVRPLTVATCDMDGIIIHGQLKLRGPVPLGHEGEGVITDVGDHVTKFAIGDRVIIPWKIACGHCTACSRRLTAQCSTVPPEDAFGWGPTAPQWGGFISDAVVVPFADHMLTALPAGVDPVLACGVADNISDGWRAVAPALAERPGGSVLVVGSTAPGSIGLYAAGLAKSLGAERVVYADLDDTRLSIAERLGCEPADLRATDPETFTSDVKTLAGGFDVTVDACGNAAILNTLLRATGRGGVCTSIAGIMYRGQDPVMPLYDMYRKSVSFHTGWVHTQAIIDGPLALIASGRFDPSPVTTVVADWDDAIPALIEPFTKVIVSRPA